MGIIKKLIFRGGTANYEINTFIGGISSVINTPQLLANKLLLYPSYEDLPVTSIKGFKIVGWDIECSIDVEYVIRSTAFQNTNSTEASPTYYRDEQGKCKILGNSSFYVSLRTDEFYFPGVLDINNSSFYHANHTSLNPRIMYFPSCTVVSGDPTIADTQQFGLGNIIQKLYINTFNQTSNNGGINATIAYGIANDNLEVAWIENLIKPNSITDLSIIEILINSVEISWTAPSSNTNTIDFYEVYVDGTYKFKTSNLTATVTGLSPETTYEIHVVVVDEFYNKSEISNVIEVTTLKEALPISGILQYAISRYKLDTDATDSIGYNDGVGTDVTYGEGLVNNAGVFNGTTSDIEIPHDSSLEFTDGVNDKPFSLSICAYFNSYDTVDGHWLINKRDSDGVWSYQFNAYDSILSFTLKDSNNLGSIRVSYAFTPILYKWYHLVATYDGSGVTGGMSIYIDGIKISVFDIVSGVYTSMKLNISVVNIGKRGWSSGAGIMDGKLDEAIIWNKELTQEEVTYLSDKQLAGIDIDPPTATGTAFSTATTGTVFSGVCATTSDTTRYHDGVGLLPEIGDNVFDDEQMQIPFDGAGLYYKVLTENYVQITNGSIVAFDLCGL